MEERNKKFGRLKDMKQVSQLSNNEKKLLSVYIHCFFTIATIMKDVDSYFKSQEDRDTISKASAFWVYYWLTEDIWKYDILNLSEDDTHRFLDEITYFFIDDFNFEHNELSQMLKDVNETDSNPLMQLAKYYGKSLHNNAWVMLDVTNLVQSNFTLYLEKLHEIIKWDDENMSEVIVDFYSNCYPKVFNRG